MSSVQEILPETAPEVLFLTNFCYVFNKHYLTTVAFIISYRLFINHVFVAL